jgi:chromosome partitioning protein
MPAAYTFPEKNPFYAREVLDTDFDIKDYPFLYVNMDESRLNEREDVEDFRAKLKFCLNIDPESNKLATLPNDYKKILFVGHRGTGKTQELRRLHRELNDPDRYFSILIEIEQELEVARLKPEDFFALLVLKIVREMSHRGLDNYTQVFDDLIKDWLRDKEVVKEIAEKKGWSVGGGVGTNDKNLLAQLVSFLKLEFNAKAEFARESKTSTVIRETIAKNFLTFVSKFNVALQEVRREVQARKKGQDILFIIDGTEKAPAQLYEDLFQRNGHIFREIGANIITTAPIDAFYRLRDRNNLNFFEQVDLPMIRLDTEAKRAALSLRGHKVLLVDLDAQCNLSVAAGANPARHHIGELLTGEATFGQTVVHKAKYDVLPAHRALLSYEYRINTEPDSGHLLADALRDQAYDYVLIDCPPSLGALTVNALVASDWYIVPMQGENFAYIGLDEIQQLVAKIKKRMNPKLELAGILLSMFDLLTKFGQMVYQKLVADKKLRIFASNIRQDIALMECTVFEQSVFDYAPDSRGAADYGSLCAEVLALVGKKVG